MITSRKPRWVADCVPDDKGPFRTWADFIVFLAALELELSVIA